MLVKEIAKNTIDQLPNDASYDDIIYALYINAKFENGLNEVNDGKGISHLEAKKRISKWLK